MLAADVYQKTNQQVWESYKIADMASLFNFKKNVLNSASPFKFHQVKFPQQTGIENNKMCFS